MTTPQDASPASSTVLAALGRLTTVLALLQRTIRMFQWAAASGAALATISLLRLGLFWVPSVLLGAVLFLPALGLVIVDAQTAAAAALTGRARGLLRSDPQNEPPQPANTKTDHELGATALTMLSNSTQTAPSTPWRLYRVFWTSRRAIATIMTTRSVGAAARRLSTAGTAPISAPLSAATAITAALCAVLCLVSLTLGLALAVLAGAVEGLL